MKKLITIFILCIANAILAQTNSIDAGITNPTDNLIIHENNRTTYILTNDLNKVRVDGWSNTGSISNIKLYEMLGTTPDTSTDNYLYLAENANSGSWHKDIDIGPGEHTIYINVRCSLLCMYSIKFSY